jgi:hypothetical protein
VKLTGSMAHRRWFFGKPSINMGWFWGWFNHV